MVVEEAGRVDEEDSECVVVPADEDGVLGYVSVLVDQVPEDADDEEPVAEVVGRVTVCVCVCVWTVCVLDAAELLPDEEPVKEEERQPEEVDGDAVNVLVRVTGPVLLLLLEVGTV